MGRRSWIFFIYSKDTAEKIKLFCEKEDCLIFIVHYVIINGTIEHYVIINGTIETKLEVVHGNELDKTPALLTQSDGTLIVREMVKRGIINREDIICLDNVARKEVEDTGDGYNIKKATYLSEKDFFDYLENKSFPRRILNNFKKFKNYLKKVDNKN